jgi:tellurite resistance protein TehA-like permease
VCSIFFLIQYIYFLKKIKKNGDLESFLPSYIKDARFLKVKHKICLTCCPYYKHLKLITLCSILSTMFHSEYHVFQTMVQKTWYVYLLPNPLNAKLNPICHLLALLGGATIVDVSRLRVNNHSF